MLLRLTHLILMVFLFSISQLHAQNKSRIDFVQNKYHQIKIWGTDSLERGLYLIPDIDSFLVVGMAYSNKRGQLMLTKLDNHLGVIWQRIYPRDGYDFCFAGTKSHDGNSHYLTLFSE